MELEYRMFEGEKADQIFKKKTNEKCFQYDGRMINKCGH